MTRLRNRKGFTLIEIMISIALLMIALLGVLSLTVMVIKANNFSKTLTTATTLAKDKIEELKNADYYSSTLSDTGGAYADDPGNPLETIYTRQWMITNNAPAAGMRKIDVRVTWFWQGRNHNIDISTIIARP